MPFQLPAPARRLLRKRHDTGHAVSSHRHRRLGHSTCGGQRISRRWPAPGALLARVVLRGDQYHLQPRSSCGHLRALGATDTDGLSLFGEAAQGLHARRASRPRPKTSWHSFRLSRGWANAWTCCWFNCHLHWFSTWQWRARSFARCVPASAARSSASQDIRAGSPAAPKAFWCASALDAWPRTRPSQPGQANLAAGSANGVMDKVPWFITAGTDRLACTGRPMARRG